MSQTICLRVPVQRAEEISIALPKMQLAVLCFDPHSKTSSTGVELSGYHSESLQIVSQKLL